MFDELIIFEDNTNSNKDNIDKFLSNINTETIIKSLETVFECTQKRGIFNMDEMYFIYVLIDKIKKNRFEA